MSYNIRNFSLEFLQKMSKEQALEYFGKHGWHGQVNFNQLVANIIVAATALRWDENRGVREFWYNPIKPIILRLFPEVNEAKGNQKKYKHFNKILSELTKEHIVSYRSLGIVDYRSMRKIYEAIERASCWSNVILFVEKDSVYVHLLPLKDLLNITIISGGGWSKTGSAEVSIADLGLVVITNKKYEIFVVSDHDPHGFEIGTEAVEKLKTLGLPVKEYHRIGISPEQMSKEIRDSQKYPVKMTLKSAPQWCEEHGLEGPPQKIYKTVNRKGVKTKELVYEGTKCYGLEIEAVSGQPGGPRLLREIVLRELLEHLEEYDRIWEITEPLWVDMPRKVVHHYLDEETFQYWQEHTHVEDLTEYYTPEDYERNKENILELKAEDTSLLNEALGNAEEELSAARRLRDVNVANKYAEYRFEIDRLWKEHISPLEETRDEEIEGIRERDNEVVDHWQGETDAISSQIYDIEEPYDEQLSNLEANYKKSRSLYAQAHFQWLKDNIQRYIDLAPEKEDLSFGLMKDCLMEALKEGETVRDLIHRAMYWDEGQACSYIGDEIEGDEDIQEEILGILEKLCEEVYME